MSRTLPWASRSIPWSAAASLTPRRLTIEGVDPEVARARPTDAGSFHRHGSGRALDLCALRGDHAQEHGHRGGHGGGTHGLAEQSGRPDEREDGLSELDLADLGDAAPRRAPPYQAKNARNMLTTDT